MELYFLMLMQMGGSHLINSDFKVISEKNMSFIGQSLFFFFLVAPMAYGNSQARNRIHCHRENAECQILNKLHHSTTAGTLRAFFSYNMISGRTWDVVATWTKSPKWLPRGELTAYPSNWQWSINKLLLCYIILFKDCLLL